MKIGKKVTVLGSDTRKITRVEEIYRDSDEDTSQNFRNKTFAELKLKLKAAKKESGYKPQIDPRIAVALTAANQDNQVFKLNKLTHQKTPPRDSKMLTDRGLNTDIEI
jgi:hypothetical protein